MSGGWHKLPPAFAACLGRLSLCLVIAVVAAVLPHASAAAAPAPADPRDLEGAWTLTDGSLFFGTDLPYTPAGQNSVAEALELRNEGRGVATPHLTCRPTGAAALIVTKAPVLILQTPRKMYLMMQEDREARFIYMNRPRPEKSRPSYAGDSVGHWEGDTLIVDSTGFNGWGLLDEAGTPQSDQSHMVERWNKSSDGNQITIEFTYSDPVYFKQSFTLTRHLRRIPGARIGEYDCAENPRADDFNNLTFKDDRFKPVCTRPVVNNVASDKVVCTSQKPKQRSR